MKIKDNDTYVGVKHDKICEHFEGDLNYVGTMPVELDSSNGKVWKPCSVYHCSNPNRAKSHKDYLLVFRHGNGMMVSGRDEKDMVFEFTGLKCLECGETMLSLDRHHFTSCGCKNGAFADGGMDYFRTGAMDLSKTETVKINFKDKQINLLT